MKKIEYKNSTERESLISQEKAAGLILIEEQNYVEGNFLVFGEPKPLSLEQRVAALEARVATLEKKP